MTDAVAQQIHDTNKATLDSVAERISPQSTAMNPLLNRSKPKKSGGSSKSKSKSGKSSSSSSSKNGSDAKDMAKAVQQVKRDELAVVSSDLAAQDEADVLDLADQLLEQLDARDKDDRQPLTAEPIPIAGAAGQDKENTGLKPPSGKQLKKSSSTSSVGSGTSARERLHDMKEGFKNAFSPHSSPSSSPMPDDTKMSRQKARKVRTTRLKQPVDVV